MAKGTRRTSSRLTEAEKAFINGQMAFERRAKMMETMKQSALAKECPEFMLFLNQDGAVNAAMVPAILKATLRMAFDHLGYCNYGDSWERECAEAAKLPQVLDFVIGEFCDGK